MQMEMERHANGLIVDRIPLGAAELQQQMSQWDARRELSSTQHQQQHQQKQWQQVYDEQLWHMWQRKLAPATPTSG